MKKGLLTAATLATIGGKANADFCTWVKAASLPAGGLGAGAAYLTAVAATTPLSALVGPAIGIPFGLTLGAGYLCDQFSYVAPSTNTVSPNNNDAVIPAEASIQADKAAAKAKFERDVVEPAEASIQAEKAAKAVEAARVEAARVEAAKAEQARKEEETARFNLGILKALTSSNLTSTTDKVEQSYKVLKTLCQTLAKEDPSYAPICEMIPNDGASGVGVTGVIAALALLKKLASKKAKGTVTKTEAELEKAAEKTIEAVVEAGEESKKAATPATTTGSSLSSGGFADAAALIAKMHSEGHSIRDLTDAANGKVRTYTPGANGQAAANNQAAARVEVPAANMSPRSFFKTNNLNS